MATPRKRSAAIETSLYREPWSRDLKLTLVMLALLMADRWAADKLTAEQASRTVLGPGDLMSITGLSDPPSQVKVMRELSRIVSLKVRPRANGFVLIEWRKFPETQGWVALDQGRSRAGDGLPPARELPGARPLSSALALALALAEEKKEERSSSKTRKIDAAEPASPAGQAAPDWKPLLNLLSKLPGDEAEKLAFLADTGPQIEVDAASYGKPVPSLTISYYRRYLAGERRFEHAAEEAIKAAKREAWQAQHGAAYEAHLRVTGGVA